MAMFSAAALTEWLLVSVLGMDNIGILAFNSTFLLFSLVIFAVY